jgi:hypothetical protein
MLALTSASDGGIIISQYYEGTAESNRWIELANTGSTGVTLDTSASPFKLSLFLAGTGQDPTDWRTGGSPDKTLALTGTIPAGGTMLIHHTSASSPSYAFGHELRMSASTTWASVDLSGNDSAVLWTGANYSFASVVDAFGVTSTVTLGDATYTNFAATTNKVYVRNANVTTGVNTNINLANWTSVLEIDVAEAEFLSENRRLGFHQVSSTPEPSTVAILVGALGLLLRRKRY